MAYGLFFTEDDNYDGSVELFLDQDHHTIEQARRAYNYQLDLLSNHEKANEYQPTENHKDLFHFYVKMEDGSERKRGMFVARVYKTPKYSLRTIVEAKEIARKHRLIKPLY